MSRKSIDDFIHGDRAGIRSYRSGFASDPYSKETTVYVPRCYEGHHPLKLPGGDLVIYGGSCLTPKIEDADIYIGFDSSMKLTGKQYPWNGSSEVLFLIQDMGAPVRVGDFKKLVEWTLDKLVAGQKIHAGCIGGHGRTGTFFAALVATLGEKNAVAYVREHYCNRAVESQEQIKFLVEHFGVVDATGSKSSQRAHAPVFGKAVAKPVEKSIPPKRSALVETFTPMPRVSIWDK
jgi:hypothetical protein